MRKTSASVGWFAWPHAHFFRTWWYMGACIADGVRGRKSWNQALFDGLSNMIEDNLPTPMNIMSCIEISRAAEAQDAYAWNWDKFWRMAVHNVTPSILQPVADVIVNINFMGQKIYKEPYINNGSKGETTNATWMYFKNTDQWLVDICKELQMATGGRDGSKSDVGGIDLNPGKIQYMFKSYTSGAAIDAYLAVKDIVCCFNAMLDNDSEQLPEMKDWVLLNRFVKPYEEDRMATSYYWDVQNSNDSFGEFYKGLSREEKSKWRSSERYKLWRESRGKMGRLGNKMKEGRALSKKEIKQLQEWSARWTMAD